MDAFKQQVSYGLRNVGRFHGRDTKQQFLPYLAFCFLSVVVLSQILTISLIPSFFTVRTSPESFDFGRIWRRNALISGLFGATFVILMAAAIARRLRDTARSAWWGLLPVPFFAVAGFSMTHIGVGDDTFEPGYFLIAFAATVVYLATVAVLAWLLTRPSHYPPPSSHRVCTPQGSAH